MIRAVRPIAALVLAAVALPASAYVRETTVRDHPESGLCLWWRARQVTYSVNATSAGRPPCGSAAGAQSAIAAGLAAWGRATRTGESSACTDFSFVQGPPTTGTAVGNDGVNLVVLRNRRCSDIPCSGAPGACAARFDCWEYEIGTIGFTTTSFDAETGELLDADMELFAWDGVPPPDGFGHYFTCEDAPRCTVEDPRTQPVSGCSWVDLTAVATHEAGHMLGLGHVDPATDAGSVMVPVVGAVAQRTLAADDVGGICTMYPKGASTLTCLPGGAVPPPKSPGGGGGGCSSAGGAGIAGLLVVALLARRERTKKGPRGGPRGPTSPSDEQSRAHGAA